MRLHSCSCCGIISCMIITCASCKTQFALPAHAIPPEGRKVKCSKCGFNWIQKPVAQKKLENIVPPPSETKPIPRGGNLPSVEMQAPVSLTWKIAALSQAVLCLLLAMLINFQYIPGMTGLRSVLGLLPLEGLSFANIHIEKERVDNRYTLKVNGELINDSKKIKKVPPIHVTALSQGKNIMLEHDIILPIQTLGPGQSVLLPDTIPGISGSTENVQLDIGQGLEMLFR